MCLKQINTSVLLCLIELKHTYTQKFQNTDLPSGTIHFGHFVQKTNKNKSLRKTIMTSIKMASYFY